MIIVPSEIEFGSSIPAEDITAEEMQQRYEAYCRTTLLRPVEQSIFEKFERSVVIPLEIYMDESIEQYPDLTSSGLRTAFEYGSIVLISRIPKLKENLSLMMEMMRCLSPLPEELYPDSYCRLIRNDIGQIDPFSRTDTKIPYLKDYPLFYRSVYHICYVFNLVLFNHREDLDYVVRSRISREFYESLSREFLERKE